MSGFEGFQEADFGIFTERCWSSHAYNRQRLEIKLKLQALARATLDRLRDFPAPEGAVTDERPSVFNQHQVRYLRWFAVRSAEERRFLHEVLPGSEAALTLAAEPETLGGHLQFLMQIEAGGFLFGLCWPPAARADRENFRLGLGQADLISHLQDLRQALGPQVLWLAGGHPLAFDELAGELARSEMRELMLVRRLEKGDACRLGAALVEETAGVFAPLIPLYRLLGWSRQNDRPGLGQRYKKQLAQAGGELHRGERVRIISGLAAGKMAVIEEVDKRGGLRVRLGNLSLSLKASDVERHEAH